MAETPRFHLAFPVIDLEATRHFYTAVLGCRLGREDQRWIDFDFNYRHQENIYGYDLFGIGNVLVFLAGMGDVLVPELKRQDHPALQALRQENVNIVFHNRVANLKKIYPYIPENLNRVLIHFSNDSMY